MKIRHAEQHNIEKIGWLRAAVLGANNGIISTASLVLGVASAHASHGNIMLTGIAGLTAGAMSMATGEYVSVHSQADTEKAAVAVERQEIKRDFTTNNASWKQFTSAGGSTCRLPSKLQNNSWPMMHWVPMRGTN